LVSRDVRRRKGGRISDITRPHRERGKGRQKGEKKHSSTAFLSFARTSRRRRGKKRGGGFLYHSFLLQRRRKRRRGQKKKKSSPVGNQVGKTKGEKKKGGRGENPTSQVHFGRKEERGREKGGKGRRSVLQTIIEGTGRGRGGR